VAGRRRLSDARRVQILNAAAQVIARRGLFETRISDIASVAGTSSALVLYYFGSKDRLLAEALTYADERFYDETMEGLSEMAGARDRLVRLIDLSCPYEVTGDRLDTWLLWLELWNRAPRDAEVAASRHRLDRRWREAIADIVRDGIASGEFHAADPEDFALRFGSLVDGLAIQVVLGDADVPRSRMLEVCLRVAGDELGFDAAVAAGSRALSRVPPATSHGPSSATPVPQRAAPPRH